MQTLLMPDGTRIYTHNDERHDFNIYSKAWHRAHGPKISILNRYIVIARPGEPHQHILVNSYRGKFLERALVGVYTPEQITAARVAARLRGDQP